MQNIKIPSYMQMSCVVLLVVLLVFIGPVSGCSTDKDCGYTIRIGNKTVFYPAKVCCHYVSPKRCMSASTCYNNPPWWTSKPTNPTPKWPDAWTPWTYKPITIKPIPVWTYPKFTYKPTYASYDDEHGSSSSNTPLIIALIVAFIFLAPLAIAYRYRNLQRAPRQTLQSVTSQSGQSEVPRNPHHIVMVISHDNRESTVAEALADEPPSYEDVFTPSTQRYDELLPPPRYEESNLPPSPRYEESNVPPPPRYEDVVNEVTATTSENNMC